MDQLLHLCKIFGLNIDLLHADLEALVKERLLMQLVGDVPGHLNYGERQKYVAKRLAKLASADLGYQPIPTNSEVVALSEVQQAIANARSETRDSVGNLDERLALDLMQLQGHRCGVCGIPLRASVRQLSDRFLDGVEPLAEKLHLDHVVPYYFLGNEGGRRILCADCNVIKNDRLGVQEDGFVVAGNHVRRRDRAAIIRRIAYWTLEANGCCAHVDCAKDSRNTVLLVQRKVSNEPFSYGNLDVFCDIHAAPTAYWIHQSDSV